jgi:hypothetical protein
MKKGTIAVFSTMIGAVAGAIGSGYLKGKTSNEKLEKVDKFKRYYHMLNQWLMLKQENKSLEKYFIDYGYKKIAIYGMGEMGIRLFDELKETSIEIKYAIDKNGGCSYFDLDVYSLNEEFAEVDAIIVSAIFAFEEIKDDLLKKVDCPIVSLDDIVFES